MSHMSHVTHYSATIALLAIFYNTRMRQILSEILKVYPENTHYEYRIYEIAIICAIKALEIYVWHVCTSPPSLIPHLPCPLPSHDP